MGLQRSGEPEGAHHQLCKIFCTAVIADNPLEAQRLLDSGLDPNGWEDPAKVGSLHFAAQHNALASAKVLIKAGAMLNAETSEGIAPLEIAMLNSHPAMVALLRKA